MMRSLFSGVAGLRSHQTRMDVIGANIANVNTVGYKSSSVNFQDIMSQTLQGASSAQNGKGGTNPMQIGLGMSIASIGTTFTDGSFQTTNKQTDLAIQGNGFFIVSGNNGTSYQYTRAGAFNFDESGNFISSSNGMKVQGWQADASGNINTSGALTSINISTSTISNITIDSNGIISGTLPDGTTKQLAQISMANFNNPSGLMRVGSNLFEQSNNSGIAQIGVSGVNGIGTINPGSLEMSNVDLSSELTNMIITQRGFQANSKIITVSDEMLQELVNLKR
jgi:flagellar hook protein FlgE